MLAVFDTLRYTKGAEKVGFTREQAEYQAEELAKMINERLATKEDLKHTESNLRKDMVKLKNDLIIKLGGMMVICASVIIGVLGFLVKI